MCFSAQPYPRGHGYRSKSPNIRALPFFSLMPSMLNNAEPSQTMQNFNHFHYFSDGWRGIQGNQLGNNSKNLFTRIEFGKFLRGITHLGS